MFQRASIMAFVGCLFVCSALVEARAQELLTNGGLEIPFPGQGGDDAVPPGWVMDESIPKICQGQGPGQTCQSLAEPSNFNHRLHEAEWTYWFQPYFGTDAMMPDNYAHLLQIVPGEPGKEYTFTGYAYFEQVFPGGVDNLNLDTGMTNNGVPLDDGLPSPTDMYFAIDFLDASSGVLGTAEVELKADGQPLGTGEDNEPYTQHTVVGISPAGTTQVRVRASMFDGVTNPSLPSPWVYRMSAFVDEFSLTVDDVEGIPGDFDIDGDVDGRDFLVWQRNPSVGNLADWQGNYGAPLTAITAVPEPATMALVSLMIGLGIARRSRQL